MDMITAAVILMVVTLAVVISSLLHHVIGFLLGFDDSLSSGFVYEFFIFMQRIFNRVTL